nr:MAG TPA: dUTPase [Caudoviricetes sp.]
MRRFERIDVPRARDAVLPKRATAHSAGYDFVAPEDIIVHAGRGFVATVKTGIKARMEPDEFLMICIRSSLGIKWGLALANGTGIIDADYYGNPNNDGEICIAFVNRDPYRDVKIQKGDRIAQGIFMKYLLAEDDETDTERNGGVGSTGK